MRLQPKVSLFAVFWARAAPKHRYLLAFGRPVLPNTIIYSTFAISYCSGCKCRRDPPPAQSIAICGVLGQGCSKTSLFKAFGRPVLPNTIIYAAVVLSYWSCCKPRRNRLPAKSIAIYSVLGQGCSKTSLFTSFWEASAPKHNTFCKSYEDRA